LPVFDCFQLRMFTHYDEADTQNGKRCWPHCHIILLYISAKAGQQNKTRSWSLFFLSLIPVQ